MTTEPTFPPDVLRAAEATAAECPLHFISDLHIAYKSHFLCPRRGCVLCVNLGSATGKGLKRTANQLALDAAKKKAREGRKA